MQCLSCTTPNPAQARFCLGCGSKFIDGHICSSCHTLLPRHAQFCTHCGDMVVVNAQGHQAILPMQPQAVIAPQAGQTLLAPTQVETVPSPISATPAQTEEEKTIPDILESLRRYLPDHLYDPMERRPADEHLGEVRDNLIALLRTSKTYLPRPVVENPQPAGVPAGGMLRGVFLFSDVSGFTPLSEKLSVFGRAGAERVTAIMNDLFFDQVTILFQYGGSLLKFGGDAALGLFPAETDEEMREAVLLASSASLAMQEMMVKYAEIDAAGEIAALRIKTGISAGEFFAAHIGTPDNMGYVTTGHTVNKAEQAEGNAEPDDVIMDEIAYSFVKNDLTVEDRAEGYYLLKSVEAEVDSRDRTLVIADDTDPPGNPEQQIAYLVERMDRLSPYMSADLLARIAHNPNDVVIMPEHRPVTVMFANYVGISDLIEDVGDTRPDLITQQLHNYFSHMAKVVEKYEGTLARMDQYAVGDRLVIFFGAPRAHEDDPIRAVRTALEMQNATRKHFAALQTPEGIYRFRQRIGINTGHLFAGNVGATALRQEYTLMGDDINMAARLMGKADWGDIFVSRKTKERVEGDFDVEDKGNLKVKGKSILIPTFKVLGRKKTVLVQVSGVGEDEMPLIGREEALKTFGEIGKAWLEGRGQILTIVGEGGRGKSRLARELHQILVHNDQEIEVRWLDAQAQSFSAQISYWLIAQVLYDVLEFTEDTEEDDVLFKLWEIGEELLGRKTAQEAIPFLAYLLDISLEGEWAAWVMDLDPQARQKQIIWAGREFFTALAEKNPTIVVLDDLHWADEASMTMLNDLFTITEGSQILFVLAFREMQDTVVSSLSSKLEGAYGHRYQEIIPHPLNDEQSKLLLSELLPGALLEDTTIETILAKSAGNPFYLGEVARTLKDSGAVIPDEDEEGSWIVTERIEEISVPDTLQGAIVARIDRLTEEARQALQMASVIGRRFGAEVIRGLADGDSELEMWISQLERSRMIQPYTRSVEEMYDFPDVLVQEVAYDSLLAKQRQGIHRQIAENLEKGLEGDENAVEILAYHFSRSDDTEKAVKYLTVAAHRAEAEYANETAFDHYTALLQLLLEGEEYWESRYEMLDRRQRVAGLIGRQDDRADSLEIMRFLADEHSDSVRQADVMNAFADMYQWTGKYDESVEIAEQALALKKEQGDKLGQAAALHNIGVVNYYQGNYEKAEPALHEAASLRKEGDDGTGQSWSELYLTMINLVSGNYGEAKSHVASALEAAESRKDWLLMGIHFNNSARIAHRLGEYEKAVDFFDKSREMRGRVGDRTGQGFTLHGQGMVHINLGEYEEAETALKKSLFIREDIDDERGVSYCLYGLGLVALGEGDLDEAVEQLQKAVDLHEKLNLTGERIADLSYLGQVYLKQSKIDEAVAISTEAIELLKDQQKVEEIQGIYLNHYRVLLATNDDSTGEYLQKAQDAITQQADAIDDPETRQIFLEKVKVNQEINAELAEMG